LSRLDELKQMVNEAVPAPPIAQLLGIDIIEVEEGETVLEMVATEEMHNPMGTLHGGILGDLADLAMGYTFYSTLRDDELFTTVEMKTNFLKPIWEGRLRAESKIIKRGKSTGLVECNIYDQKGSLVAYVTSICMVIKGGTDGKRHQK